METPSGARTFEPFCTIPPRRMNLPGATLALANVVGSLLGTRLALKHGTAFVRVFFIVVVSALILKTGFDAFFRETLSV